ncbi:MAG: hypothetical protein AAFV09_16270, partial [Pseudomonadota bacterium]
MSAAPETDERVKEISPLKRALIRPELGGMVGTVAVFTLFALFAFDSGMFAPQGIMNWSIISAQFMIIAVGACLLMIAGEFDPFTGPINDQDGVDVGDRDRGGDGGAAPQDGGFV